MVVAVNDVDLEQVDVASVWLDVRVAWWVLDHIFYSGSRFCIDGV